MTELRFVVDGEPVPWSRPNIDFRSGRIINKPELEDFENEVHAAVIRALAERGLPWGLSSKSKYRAELAFYRAREKGDLTNYVKAVEDGMNTCAVRKRRRSKDEPMEWKKPRPGCLLGCCRGAAWSDDARLYDYRARMSLDRDNPRTEVRVWLVEGD